MKIVDTSKSRYAILEGFGIDKIGIADNFWAPKIEVNRRVSLPHQYRECERTGRVDNFRIAAGIKKGKFKGIYFNDSDVHKLMEGVSLDLAAKDSPIRKSLEDFISLAAKTQQTNGYLNTYFMINKAKKWKHLSWGHELYTAGHMLQAAVAHHRVTGKDNYLNIARKWADGAYAYFGPGKHRGTCGHPEAEMALIELYRETGDKKYFNLAKFFLEERGKKPFLFNGDTDLQDHLPIREQKTMVGHAVRQFYLCSGEADYCAETGDKKVLAALKKQWDNFVNSKMYLTGGAGSNYIHESFEEAYQLPNRAYAETCASIASFMWNWRMFLLEANAKYTDLMETVMYNGILSGMSLDGKRYFYANPLEHKAKGPLKAAAVQAVGGNQRTSKHWDGTACCPPNVARFFAYFRGSIYSRAKTKPGLFINFYAAGTSKLDLAGTSIKVTQKTNYPWDGKIVISVDPDVPSKFTVNVRIPGWVKNAQVSFNGKPVKAALPGSYLSLNKEWKKRDTIELLFPMPVERTITNEIVTTNTGCTALKRGPLVYCIESADFGKNNLFEVVLPKNAKLTTEHRPSMLKGVTVIKGNALLKKETQGLYSKEGKEIYKKIKFTAIPYFAWANRKPGMMRVWIPET